MDSELAPRGAPRNDECNFAFPRRKGVRVLLEIVPLDNQRAQGMPGARCTRGLVRNGEWECAHEHTGSAEAPGIPCVMALRLMPRSPRRRIRLVTVIGGCSDRSTRSGLNCHHRLGTSNGCQDHTVLPYATTSFVLRAFKIAHEVQLALRPPWRADALASTTSHPAFVTTRDRPSCRNGTAGAKPLIWGRREAESCPSCHSAATRRAVVLPAALARFPPRCCILRDAPGPFRVHKNNLPRSRSVKRTGFRSQNLPTGMPGSRSA
jgi:hypothetical protein